jgi:hypothetical protein
MYIFFYGERLWQCHAIDPLTREKTQGVPTTLKNLKTPPLVQTVRDHALRTEFAPTAAFTTDVR